MSVLQALFDGLERGDGALVASTLSPQVRMHFVERGADGSMSEASTSVEDLVARVTGSPAKAFALFICFGSIS